MKERSNRVKRLTEWWRPKAGVLLSVTLFYLLVWDIPFVDAWPLLSYAIITLLGFGIVGYLLNDWADIDDDRKVGKTNLLAGVPIGLRFFYLAVALIITAFPWCVYFKTDYLSWIFIALQLLLLIAYPLKPFRLKRYPQIAVFVDSLYAFVVPAILAWHTYDITLADVDSIGWLHFALLGIWMLSMGLRHILNHHVADRVNDRRTSTPNLALNYSPLVIRKGIQLVLFPIEVLASSAFFASVGNFSGYFPIIMAILVAYCGVSQFSQYGFRIGFNRTSLDRFSSFWLGFISVLTLAMYDAYYLILAFGFLALFSDLFFHPLVEIGLRRIVAWLVAAVRLPFQLGSLWFNWSLYYFRKWILGWSEERNWGEHYNKHLADVELNKRKKRGVVATFNQNHNKYTETFVRGHTSGLNYHVVSFHGWPSPVHSNNMENLISEEAFLQKARYNIWKLGNVDSKQKEDAIIAERLMAENADVILAEFGTMGRRLVPVSKMTGIPMVCIFYGYDAWNQDVLDEMPYDDLFDHAEKLIGVSKDICERLKNLGCPSGKIHYLPCYVNLNLFTPVQRQFDKLNLLAVGRFSSTKAPHLTVLAFNEIIKKVPDATLTMVGGDDDDEMYEFCVSLIRSLRLEKQVILKGKLAPDQVKTSMDEATMFIQHSVTTPIKGDKEGTPVAVMEAMACGLPVVATRHAGIAEIITHEVSGILIDEFDFEQMAQQVVALFSSADKMQRISSSAIEAISKNNLITHHVSNLEMLLAETIEQK